MKSLSVKYRSDRINTFCLGCFKSRKFIRTSLFSVVSFINFVPAFSRLQLFIQVQVCDWEMQ